VVAPAAALEKSKILFSTTVYCYCLLRTYFIHYSLYELRENRKRRLLSSRATYVFRTSNVRALSGNQPHVYTTAAGLPQRTK
jgi:hypothetical protein